MENSKYRWAAANPGKELKDFSILDYLNSSGCLMSAAAQAIKKIKRKLLERESFLKEALQNGSKSFMDLNKALLGKSPIIFSRLRNHRKPPDQAGRGGGYQEKGRGNQLRHLAQLYHLEGGRAGKVKSDLNKEECLKCLN